VLPGSISGTGHFNPRIQGVTRSEAMDRSIARM